MELGREELLERFPAHPWLDVLSKCDLPDSEREQAEAAEARAAVPGALRVSVQTGEGCEELAQRLQARPQLYSLRFCRKRFVSIFFDCWQNDHALVPDLGNDMNAWTVV